MNDLPVRDRYRVSEVAAAFGVSRDHVKKTCRALGIDLYDASVPGATRAYWMVPREGVLRLHEHFGSRSRPSARRSR